MSANDDFLEHIAEKSDILRIVEALPEGAKGILVWSVPDTPGVVSHRMFGPGSTPVHEIAGGMLWAAQFGIGSDHLHRPED